MCNTSAKQCQVDQAEMSNSAEFGGKLFFDRVLPLYRRQRYVITLLNYNI